MVLEERRMRVESNPQGKLMEALLGHRVRRRILIAMCRAAGPATSRTCALTDAEQFYKTYYVPSEHHDRHRGRRESGGGEAPGREVFRPLCRAPAAAAGAAPWSRRRRAASAWTWNRPASR